MFVQRTCALLPEHAIVPNTLEMALQPSSEPRAVMKAVAAGGAFAMLHVNLAWTQLTGLRQSEAEGRSFPAFAALFTPAAEVLMGSALDCLGGKASSAIVPVPVTKSLGYLKASATSPCHTSPCPT
jgi:hypothetical protein